MNKKTLVTLALGVCLAVAASADAAIEYVPVGNAGNAGELSGYLPPPPLVGGVAYEYRIGKYEVTAGQYAEFLNAKAGDADPMGLYNAAMAAAGGCGITKAGAVYTATSPNLPVNYVNWGDAARFANWIENGQGAGNMEDGAYTLNGAVTKEALAPITRNGAALYFMTSEDEWYKAAYHKNDGVTANYWDYAIESDTLPTAEAPAGTDLVNGSANYANAVGNIVDVGSYTALPSDSAYGTFDQTGNVEEWTDTIFDVYGTDYFIHRGGAFNDSTSGIAAHGGRTGVTDRTLEADVRGFRMATTVPEPATMSLLALGGLGVLRRRRK